MMTKKNNNCLLSDTFCLTPRIHLHKKIKYKNKEYGYNI